MSNQVISYYRIRRAVGLIGILLPFVLWWGNVFLSNSSLTKGEKWICYTGREDYESLLPLKPSISHFYYTTVGEVFTGALCAVALFLFCYRGFKKPTYGPVKWFPGDNAVANAAGAFALIVVLFPTAAKIDIRDNFRSYVSTDLTGAIHYIAASLFFITLAFMSIINFRRTGNPNQFGKMQSHKYYLWCGIIMLACITTLGIIYFAGNSGKDISWSETYSVTFILETIMLIAFGTSWLIKGRVDSRVFKKNIFGHGVPKKNKPVVTPPADPAVIPPVAIPDPNIIID